MTRRVLDFLAGSLSGMLLGAVLLAAIVPTPLDWSKEAVPTSRPPEHADQPTGPGWMTTEDPLPSPDVAPGAGAPDRITPAPPLGSPPSTERGRGPESTVPPWTSMTLRGTASFVAPSFGPRYLALPEGPGVTVTICAEACVRRTSTDAGPDLAMQRAGRVADLSFHDFAAVCACDPWAVGLVRVTVDYRGGPTPPPTTTEETP